MTELDAETRLCELFAMSGGCVRRQVALGGKHLDVAVRLRPSDGDWWAVEVKLHDWRRAVRQACINAAFFGASFVAVPEDYASRIDRSYLSRRGVGLIRFSEDAWWIEVEAASRSLPQVLVSSMNELLA